MAEPTMDEVVNVEEALQPCDICGRTFLPGPLETHMRVCERNAAKKRKVFDSLKQRVDGTELATFQTVTVKKNCASSEPSNKRNRWKERHIELVNAIRAARSVNVTDSTATVNNSPMSSSVGDRCPSCDRVFGPRAYDRHVEWCKERNSRVQRSPADVLLAKERLAARTQYKVPLPNKSKRSIVKEKYSPTIGNRTGSFSSTKSSSCTNLERASNTRKLRRPEPTPHDHGDGMDSVTEEPISKKNEKPKERKALPEIKPALDPKSGVQPDYNPFITAERQLMELLECDDFKPFFNKKTIKPIQRPHTVNVVKITQNRNAQNKILKSAENVRKKLDYNAEPIKRASVIDPPSDFQDADDFEIIESLINQNCLDGRDEFNILNETSNKIFSESVKNLLSLSSECENNLINKNNKYNDDVSTIDPRLINENDNLAIPKNLIVDSSSSTSSNDHVKPLVTAMGSFKLSANSTNRLAQHSDIVSFSTQKPIKPIIRNARLNIKKQPKQTTSKSMLSLNSSFVSSKGGTDKRKSVTTVKRAVSIKEAPDKPSLKSRQDVEDYFHAQEKKNKVVKPDKPKQLEGLKKCDQPKADDLFSIDDELYEEYKKYEEMYLKEKQLKSHNAEVPLTEDYDDIDYVNGSNVSKSNEDSAYNSLNRSNPKIRSKLNKLNPLEYQKPASDASPSSSGSEAGATIKKKRKSKFCHECGNKYPIDTAKFCVECGAKRLTL